MLDESKACLAFLRSLPQFWAYNKIKDFFIYLVIRGVGLKLNYILMVKYEVNMLESFLFCQSKNDISI